VIALALLLAVAPGAAPAAAKPAPTAPASSPAAAPATSPPAAASSAPAAAAEAPGPPAAAPDATPAAPGAEDAVDAEVMGFLSLTQSTASRDGGVKLPWDGPGGSQLKLSWDALDRRNEMLATGDMMARALRETVRQFYETEGGLNPEGMKAKLRSMVAGPMEEARQSYLDAITWEDRRLFFVEKALAQADAAGVALPGVDGTLVARRARAIRSGAAKKALEVQMNGYRDLALGLVAYLDGDNFGALERVRAATQALPDFAVAHAFLGSIYFLFDQKDAALTAWRRAYELDPTNQAVADALKEYGRPRKSASPPPKK
jgi:tetratricopeptide (TPR) repeat protein